MTDDQNLDSSSAEWRVPEEQLETDAYHIWKPRPLLRSVHWKPVQGVAREEAAGSYDVFLDQRVFTAMHQHLWNAPPGEEPFGFLTGDLCEDPDTGRRYLIVSAAIPARFQLDEDGEEQIPDEALVALQLEVDRRRGVLAGWYHRHRRGDVCLSAGDLRTHERHFSEPWQVALLFVTDPESPSGGCFRRTREGLSGDLALPFFEMVSNESLLARGQRRSFVDWGNVETVDTIQSEPPPRPARMPELEPRVVEAGVEPALGTEEGLPASEAAAEPDSGPPEPGAPLAGEPEGDFDLILPVLDDEGEPVEIESPEPEVPVLEEEIVTEDLDSIVGELGLGEIDLPAELSQAEEGDELPEPGWDSPLEAGPATPLAADEVDLGSFVTEVEAADVDAQMLEGKEEGAAEPDWDAPERAEEPVDDEPADDEPADDELIVEPLVTTAVYDELPLPDLEVVDGTAEPPESEAPVDVSEEHAPAADSEAEGVVTPPAAVRRRRSRRPLALAVGVVVVAAVIVGLLAVLRSEGPGEGVRPTTTPGVGPAEPAAESEEPALGDAAGAETVAAIGESASGAVTEPEMESLGDSLLGSISRYYGLAVALDDGRASCADLQAAYVEVDSRWMTYNIEGKVRFQGRLPDDLATRDERLYAGVQDVEREFGQSGCERP